MNENFFAIMSVGFIVVILLGMFFAIIHVHGIKNIAQSAGLNIDRFMNMSLSMFKEHKTQQFVKSLLQEDVYGSSYSNPVEAMLLAMQADGVEDLGNLWKYHSIPNKFFYDPNKLYENLQNKGGEVTSRIYRSEGEIDNPHNKYIVSRLSISGESVYIYFKYKLYEVDENEIHVLKDGVELPIIKIKGKKYVEIISNVSMFIPPSFTGKETKVEIIKEWIESSQVITKRVRSLSKATKNIKWNTLIPIMTAEGPSMKVSQTKFVTDFISAVKPVVYKIKGKIKERVGYINYQNFLEQATLLFKERTNCLFYGPPRTGKTSASMMLAKTLAESGAYVFYLPSLKTEEFPNLISFLSMIENYMEENQEIKLQEEEEEFAKVSSGNNEEPMAKSVVIFIDDLEFKNMSPSELAQWKTITDGPLVKGNLAISFVVSTNDKLEEMPSAANAAGRIQVQFEFLETTAAEIMWHIERGNINLPENADFNEEVAEILQNESLGSTIIPIGIVMNSFIEQKEVYLFDNIFESQYGKQSMPPVVN